MARELDWERMEKRMALSRPPATRIRFLLGWLLGFISLLLPARLRARLRERPPVGAREVATVVAKRVALSIAILLLADRFARRAARGVMPLNELRTRLEGGLGRPPTTDELMHAWMAEERESGGGQTT